MNATVAKIRRLFGTGAMASDAESKTAHDPKNGQFTSGSGGASPKKGASSPPPVLSYRASKLEAVNNKLKEGIKRLNALSRLGDKVDGEYMDIAEKEGINWNSDWQSEYLKTHSKIPLDIKYDEENQKFMDEFKSITGGSNDTDEIKHMVKVNNKKINKIKKKIAEVEPKKTKNKANKYR